jgi:hydrogenase-4 component F
VEALLVLTLAAPLIGAALSVAGRPRLSEAATAVSALAAFAAALALAIDVSDGHRISTLGGWLALDALGGVFLIATGLLYATGAVFSVGYLRTARPGAGTTRFATRYFALFNLFAWTMLLVPMMGDFATLWVAVELTTIVSVLLVALDRTAAALEAAWKYALIASVGLGIALLAVIVLYAAGTEPLGPSYVPRFGRYVEAAAALPPVPVEVAFLLAVVGFGTKVGFAPLHTWLPDAHSEAPSPVSALLSGALLADALYAVLRFYQVTALAAGDELPRRTLLIFGTASLVVAALFVLRQESYKRLLAYSTIEHMGVVAVGVGFGARIAVAGAMLHVISHAAAKGLAFFGSGAVLRRYDTKEIDRVRGAATALPWSGPMLLGAALALAGLPLSGVFRSEFQIVIGGMAAPEYAATAALLVLVNVAFLGLVWHVGRMVLSSAPAGAAVGEPSAWMVAPMAACLIVSIGLGLHVPSALSDLLGQAATALGA